MSEPFDLQPLGQGDRDTEEECRLGRDFHELFPRRQEPLPEGLWESLAPVAERHAQRREQRHHARRLVASLRPRRLLVPLVLAASVALVFLVWHQLRKAPAPRGGSTGGLARLTGSPASPTRSVLGSGATLEIAGELVVEERGIDGERVLLQSGSVRATVPHLAPGQSFVVHTGQADVVVHGTRFTVDQSSNGTTVSVEEGLVEVRPLDGHRPASFVKPGGRVVVVPFPAYVASLKAALGDAVDTEKCEGSQELVTKYLEVASSAADMSEATYLEGLCAARQGHRAEAIRFFEQAAMSAPQTRADNALARAAQLHEKDGARAGVDAWHHYLERFPQGLHQELATEFLTRHESSASP